MYIKHVIFLISALFLSACGLQTSAPTSAPIISSPTPDSSPPTITLVDPDVDAKEITIDSVIRITFSELLDESSITEGAVVVKDQDIIVEGEISIDGLSLIFSPADPFGYGHTYTVVVGIMLQDISGNQLENETSWTFKTEGPFTILSFQSPFFGEPSDTASFLMDFDSDGDLDLIVGQNLWPPEPSPLSAFRNDGNGVFTDATSEVFDGQVVMVENPRHWAIADFNGDGLDDVLIVDHGFDWVVLGGENTGGQSLILMQNANGQLINETSSRIPAMLAFTHNVCVADIDNDGDVDIYMGNRPGQVHVGPRFYINDGDGIFTDDTARIPFRIASRESFADYGTCTFIDADNDGDFDLFLGGNPAAEDQDPSRDTLLLNDGAGSFSYSPANSLPPRTEGIEEEVGAASADFNQDGWLDIVIAGQVDNEKTKKFTNPELQLLINNGDGTFRDETQLLNQDWESSIKPGKILDHQNIDWPVIVDYNNDGWPDIYTVNWNIHPVLFENLNGEGFIIAEKLDLYIQTSAGKTIYYPELYSLSISYLIASRFPVLVLIGDLDGDGDQDYVVIYDESETHAVLLRK